VETGDVGGVAGAAAAAGAAGAAGVAGVVVVVVVVVVCAHVGVATRANAQSVMGYSFLFIRDTREVDVRALVVRVARKHGVAAMMPSH
jgi:hypothetical protein